MPGPEELGRFTPDAFIKHLDFVGAPSEQSLFTDKFLDELHELMPVGERIRIMEKEIEDTWPRDNHVYCRCHAPLEDKANG